MSGARRGPVRQPPYQKPPVAAPLSRGASREQQGSVWAGASAASVVDVVWVFDPVVAAIIPVVVDNFARETAVGLAMRERTAGEGRERGGAQWSWELFVVLIVQALLVGGYRGGKGGA